MSPSTVVDSPSPQTAVLPGSVLIAEDELLIARSLADILTDLGIGVIGPVATGQAAVALARERKPDLAILDIRMPEMTGLEAGRVMHDELNVPVVIITAYSDEAYVHEGCAMGVYGYLLKPVTIDHLRANLAVAWSRVQRDRQRTEEVRTLERKLQERKIIERAKGLLMQRKGLAEDEAMRLLQKQARDARRPMAELAQSLLDAAGLTPSAHPRDKGSA